jgi:hypothetical protein
MKEVSGLLGRLYTTYANGAEGSRFLLVVGEHHAM